MTKQEARRILGVGDSLEECAARGLDHLLKARVWFQIAGSRRTVARIDKIRDSARGAVRAAGYRQRRLERVGKDGNATLQGRR